ncbi:MAG: glycerol-3-phosphate acyltransferase [Caldiserica bacterium]|nr:glycerol-3-phosphate acyltransferase [Caldisericota bacterium]
MNSWLQFGALVVASYLWGSVCWGLVLSFLVKHEDIRLKDNPGLSGSVRQYGWGYGLTVGLLDVMKGYLLSLLLHSMAIPPWVPIASFVAVIVGHNWPIFFQFRGGGGVATTLGILLQGYPLAILLALPFAGVAGVMWKLVPRIKANVHFSPFIAGVGAIPAAIWIVMHKPWYPDYVIVVGLAASVLLKGNQFHVQAQRIRTYAYGMRDRFMDHYRDDHVPPTT